MPENVDSFKALTSKIFPDKNLDDDNRNFVDFLDQCLALDPAKRISVADALKHPFMMMLINRVKKQKGKI